MVGTTQTAALFGGALLIRRQRQSSQVNLTPKHMFFAELCRHLINKIAGDCTKLATEQNARIYRKFIFGVQLQLR